MRHDVARVSESDESTQNPLSGPESGPEDRLQGMSGLPRYAWQRGQLVPFADAGVSLADRGLLFGESVYEVLPITAGRTRWVGPHLARMREGAAALSLAVPTWLHPPLAWPDALVAAEGLVDGLLYVQLTGGPAPRGHLARGAGDIFAYAMPHDFPDAARRARGVAVISRDELRWARCDLKTTMLLPSVLAKREARAAGADEVLWVDTHGNVVEGGSSNVAIVERGVLVTPPPGPWRLPGITLAIVEGLAAAAGLPWRFEPLPRARVRGADEVFITATSQLVMPVVAIDGAPVGSGSAGPIALRLGEALRESMARA